MSEILSNAKSQKICKFSSILQRARTQEYLLDEDFEIFKSFSLELLDRDYFNSIHVIPPKSWWEIHSTLKRSSSITFEEMIDWLSDMNNWKNLEKERSRSFFQLDYFLTMTKSPSVAYSAIFLKRLCSDLDAKSRIETLEGFAEHFEFTEDSLTLNFSGYVFKSNQRVAIPLRKIFSHFSNSNLKSISISSISVWNCFDQFQLFIDSNRLSLAKLKLENVSYSDESADFKIHLPNLEEWIVNVNTETKVIEKNFTFGNKLTHFDASEFGSLPRMDAEEIVSPDFGHDNTIDITGFINFIKMHPNLECYCGRLPDDKKIDSSTKIICQDECIEDVTKALRSLKKLKKFSVKCSRELSQGIENYVGSDEIEHLCFPLSCDKINWKFMKRLQKLQYLDLRYPQNPFHHSGKDKFYAFLKLDRLRHLSVIHAIIADKKFFKVISQLKNLKELEISGYDTINPVIPDSIEVLVMNIFVPSHAREISGEEDSFQITDLFPKGKGVIFFHLSFSTSFPGSKNFNFRNFFPKIEKVTYGKYDYDKKYITFDRILPIGKP